MVLSLYFGECGRLVAAEDRSIIDEGLLVATLAGDPELRTTEHDQDPSEKHRRQLRRFEIFEIPERRRGSLFEAD